MATFNPLSQLAARCSPGSGFSLDLPTWYKYLECGESNTPIINSLSDVWSIAAAILEMVIYVGGVAAIFFIIYGGIQFTISHGQPDKIAQARTTVLNAVAGLIIAVIAVATVRFIAGAFGASEFVDV